MSDAPPKFINENGVRKLNPAWKAWKNGGVVSSTVAPQQQQGPTFTPPPMRNDTTALPVISNHNELSQLGGDAQFSAGAQQAQQQFATAQTAQQVGLSQDQLLNELGVVFAKYEIPVGLLSKLLILQQFQFMELIIDDSGSMNASTDSKHPNGRQMTRWEEVNHRLLQMFELLAYVPFPPANITFLNRSDKIVLEKNPNEHPTAFLQRVGMTLQQTFSRHPSGTTPAEQRIREQLNRVRGKSALCYFFGDGVPNGGESAQEAITQMIKRRPNPSQTPYTFMSCTNEDEACEWMRDCEEESPYCSEYDDYRDESDEILKDQGTAFSYSYGVHLVSQIVGACFPDDLDACDESAPFTKNVISELLGYNLSDQEYNYYFDEFMKAQHRKRAISAEDRIKADYVKKWPGLREEFRRAAYGKDIPEVQQYRKALMDHKNSCCVIA